VTRDHEELLRRLALCDEGAASAATGAVGWPAGGSGEASTLDARLLALARLAGLIAVSSSTASYQWCIASAIAAGATDDEIVAVLVGIAPVVGAARVVSAAADVAVALGYDLDLAFEARDARRRARPDR
jgi:hypothetical protein